MVDILAIGAHPDDVELSAAGTLMKHKAMGKTFALVDLTEGEMGTRGTVETRYEEAGDAAKIIGAEARVNLQMRDGFFEETEANLLKLIVQIRRFKPSIVLANAVDDRHPDHGRASHLISRACFLAGLRKIETTFEGVEQEAHRPAFVYHYIQDRLLTPDFVVDVSDFVEQKFNSIKAYKTQFWDPTSNEPKTPISGEEFFEFLRGRMSEFGRRIHVKYAEGFTVERTIGVDSFFDLK